jgi:hypothetical protein
MCENEEDEEACVEDDAMQALLDAADFGAFKTKQTKRRKNALVNQQHSLRAKQSHFLNT